MTDDLKDIDPEIVEAVLANAGAFIDADTQVDSIIEWGEKELKAREEAIKNSGGTLRDFKQAVDEIGATVAAKLRTFEQDIHTKYQAGAAE